MKRIWLINQYAMPPELESRLRTIKFAQYLTQKGYDVTIFASSIMHNMNVDLITDNSLYIERTYGDIKFVHIKTKFYNSNGISRIIGSFQFPRRLIKISKKFPKPDIIIQTATVPFGNSLYFLAKKFNAKYIVEVLDLWPESFVELGIINKKNPLLHLAYKAEKWLYEKADEVVFSMEGGADYIKSKGWDVSHGGKIKLEKVHYINNGVDLKDFELYTQKYQLNDTDLANSEIKKVIYIGSIRLANNLMQLINSAQLLLTEKDIKFLLYGDGDDRATLEKYCIDNNITNVVFKEKWIEPKFVPYVLSCSTVNILNYMPCNLGNFGGSQSKMFQYMASGKPICCNLRMSYCPINYNKIGISKEFKNPQEYANAILELVKMDKIEYNEMCIRSRNTAKNYDYQFLTEKLEKLIN